MDGATLKTPVFQTPARILIPKLVHSRAGWKSKASERKKRLKAARIRIRDLGKSREHWKEQASAAEKRAAELERQLEQARQEVAAVRNDNDQLRDELKKK